MTKQFICPIDKPVQQMGVKTKAHKLYIDTTKKNITAQKNTFTVIEKKLYPIAYNYKKNLSISDQKNRLYSSASPLGKITDKKIKDKIIKLVKLEREYNNKMKIFNNSKVIQNVINYDYMSKIPPPVVPCEYVKQNCQSYNNGKGPDDVRCCDKGELKVLRCGIVDLNDCKDRKKIKSTKALYSTALKNSKSLDEYFKKFTTGSLKDPKYKQFAFCPSLVNDKKQFCYNLYDFSHNKNKVRQNAGGSGVKIERKTDKKITGNKLSESVYDNVKSLGLYGRMLTDPNIGVGSDYLISTHKCIDEEGKEQYVQTPIRNSGERVDRFKKIADAINNNINESTGKILNEDNKIIYKDVQDAKFMTGFKKKNINDNVTFKGYEFKLNEEVHYLVNMDASSGLVYTLIDDIKETNPVSLLTRFIAQSENTSMKCKDMIGIEKRNTFPFSQYVVEPDGYDLNDNITLTTTREYPVNMKGCYVVKEGFSKNNYYLEIIILLFILVIFNYL